ncbi:ABC transporter ATP-binding protein [Nocardioides sp.]|uniref:ABC transporter ATP-binding protein n=1 Tax=Nocardioides sp. TaxID=35761 RepID=UPI003D134519
MPSFESLRRHHRDPDKGLQVDSLSVAYAGHTVLDSVSFEVRPHEVVGIIGPNGAGKTTLLDLVCGRRTPDSGRVSWGGRRIGRTKPHRLATLGISRVEQDPVLAEDQSVLSNVMAGADRRERSSIMPRPERRQATAADRVLSERAREILRTLGILDHEDDDPAGLPWGVRGRVHLAKALITEPQLVVLDEPGAGLSRADATALGRTVRRLTHRVTFLLVDHRMDLVLDVCDRVVVLVEGRVVASGTPDQIRADPAVQAAYLHED